MANPLDGKFVVAISSRSLFDLEEADAVFRAEGLTAYREYQREHEDEPLAPGTGFRLVRALLAINERVAPERAVEVVIISRNDADTGLRVFNSIEARGLDITRGAFRNGRDPWRFLKAFRSSLFLSKESADVIEAIRAGVAAARTLAPPDEWDDNEELAEVRIALDGDAVLFSDESERIYQQEGVEAFQAHEVANAEIPLPPGPFKPFLDSLARLQQRFSEEDSPIRTMLVTARGAPSHKRVVKTLRTWNVRIDESFFLGGATKSEILDELRPHIFFDDQLTHLDGARAHTPSGHVIAVPEDADGQRTLGLLEAAPTRRGGRKVKAAQPSPADVPVGPTHSERTPSQRVRQNVLNQRSAVSDEDLMQPEPVKTKSGSRSRSPKEA